MLEAEKIDIEIARSNKPMEIDINAKILHSHSSISAISLFIYYLIFIYLFIYLST